MNFTPEMITLVSTLFSGSVGFAGLWWKGRVDLRKEKQARVEFERLLIRDDHEFEERIRNSLRLELERVQDAYFKTHRELEAQYQQNARVLEEHSSVKDQYQTMRREVDKLTTEVQALRNERTILKRALDNRDAEIKRRDIELARQEARLIRLQERLNEFELKYEQSEPIG